MDKFGFERETDFLGSIWYSGEWSAISYWPVDAYTSFRFDWVIGDCAFGAEG